MAYPEIVAAMQSSESVGDDVVEDWESNKDVIEATSENENDKVDTKESSKDNVKSTSVKLATQPVKDDSEEDNDDIAEVEGDPREHLNLVFIGHVDAGKSTLSGSILYLMGKVDARTIERFEKEAKNRNRESWFLAFIMDTSEEERAKGKTVEVGRAGFETETHRYTILDAPGHKNYVPNMISGAAQADVGILVISARRGEFETGFEKGGQTREHALLAKTLGVRFLVVVINKMDDHTVEWSEERFNDCVTKLKPYLKNCGYAIKKEVRFVPISGLTGDNILNEVSAERCPWWKESCDKGQHNTTTRTLISTLDSLTITDRHADAPLRVPCLDRYLERGCVMLGKVESGTLTTGEKVAILPTKKTAVVEAIYADEVKIRCARPGENVLVKFNLNIDDLQKGFVISSIDRPCNTAHDFVAQLAIIDMPECRPIFTSGYDCIVHLHTAEIEVECVSLLSVTDKKGKETKKRFAAQGEMCMAHLRVPLLTCMEPFMNMPALGRITLRDEQRTIAIGKVVKLLRKKVKK
jgi:peptide chain release factor subunit 3